jgi:UDP-N-acetylglucosamine transferase subunit ALG13
METGPSSVPFTEMSSSEVSPTAVFVSLGTDHHPFDRLLTMIGAWAADHPEVTVLVQSGHTEVPAALHLPSVTVVPFLDVADLDAQLSEATAVVCHGGPSTIMEARAAGHTPIVAARDPARGEHVDGHQQRFVARIARDAIVVAVDGPHPLSGARGPAVSSGPPAGRRRVRD